MRTIAKAFSAGEKTPLTYNTNTWTGMTITHKQQQALTKHKTSIKNQYEKHTRNFIQFSYGQNYGIKFIRRSSLTLSQSPLGQHMMFSGH